MQDEKLIGNTHYININGLWFEFGNKIDMFCLDILRYMMQSTPPVIYSNEKFIISV